MWKVSVTLLAAVVVLASCGPSASDIANQQRDAEMAAQKQREDTCVRALAEVYDKAVAVPLESRPATLKTAALTDCPGEIASDYTMALSSLEAVVSADHDLMTHEAQQTEAQNQGIVNGGCEVIGLCPQGSTPSPYRDWSDREAQLKTARDQANRDFARARDKLEAAFAARGFMRTDIGPGNNAAAPPAQGNFM